MDNRINHFLYLLLRKTLLLPVVFFFTPYISFTQCTVTISTFPFKEDFETSNGNWLTGGVSSDWKWGIPSKPVINSAASGLKCWMTGELDRTGYGGGQNAWLKSPCFNFTNLNNPFLVFKVFWETEGLFDGANLQYSTDNGSTWQLIGNKNEAGTCLTERWYNGGPLPSLNDQDAWQGNIQSSRPPCYVSGGSAGWVTARHSVPELGGQANVMFRFVFGSSSSCNDFDGFAVDDFSIEEAPPSLASFTYNCSSNLRVNFVNKSTLCPTSFLWDFGDPASGTNNTSTLPDPTHAYTGGGTYDVSLTVYGPGNTSSTFRLYKLEIIENMTASIVTPIRCYDDTTGSATVNFIGDSSGISFAWDTNPVQTTRTAINLGAGDYNVTILNKEGCPASAHISLGEPPPMLYHLTLVKPNCSTSNGSIDIAMRGGLGPYNFSWTPGVSATSSARNIPSGAYKVTVLDRNQCYKVIDIALPDLSDLAATMSTTKSVSCFGGNDGIATARVTGGTTPYSYSWSPNNGNAATNNNLPGGNYTVTVTDANGCKAIATASMPQPSALSSEIKLQNTFCGLDNGTASVEVVGGSDPYQYNWSSGISTSSSAGNLAPGLHTVIINDRNGCIINDTAVILPSSAIQLQLLLTNVLCAGGLTGAAEARVTGGTAPYNFQWTNSTQTFNSQGISGVAAGTYHLKLDDAVGCTVTESFFIEQPEPLKIAITTNPSYCNFNDGSASADVSGGVSPYRFNWTTNNNTTSSLTNVYAGNYELTVKDQNDCSASIATTIVNNNPDRVSLGADTTLCPGNRIILSPGNYSRYKWQDNSSAANYNVTKGGIYSVEVTDNLGCVLKDTVKIIDDCGFIFFPNAFTPNNDMQNDLFGPLGVLPTVKDYTLLIYNRLGQLVFKSTDPFIKWNGKMGDNTMIPGVYVWVATYSNKGVTNIVQKGTVTVVR